MSNIPEDWATHPMFRQMLELMRSDLDNALTTFDLPPEVRSRFENFAGYIEGILGKEGDRDD
jgi:hypothetical protein